MGAFAGGSAYAMVEQVAGGYLLVTERTFRRLVRGELDQLGFELEKKLRSVRGEQPALDDMDAVRLRNRAIQRLNAARMMLQTYRRRNRT